MRRTILTAAMLLGLAACAPEGAQNNERPQAAAPGYTMDLFAREQEQIYLVGAPDGKLAAARVDGGTSAMIAADEAHRLLDERQQAFSAPEHQAVNIQAGGLRLAISGSDDGAKDGKGGAAHIDVNVGGHGMTLDAEGDDANGRARIHITGADAASARQFITDDEHLSEDVKHQMLQQLGL